LNSSTTGPKVTAGFSGESHQRTLPKLYANPPKIFSNDPFARRAPPASAIAEGRGDGRPRDQEIPPDPASRGVRRRRERQQAHGAAVTASRNLMDKFVVAITLPILSNPCDEQISVACEPSLRPRLPRGASFILHQLLHPSI
jgi:hypothetical protein